jgi:pimeloyl-ACP methyl ester carboxylesterase
MTTFALIHGGGHGGWCWQRLQSSLARLGHQSIAPDLPIEDDNAGATEYASAVLDAVSSVPEPIVVVGHSLGGLVVPLVAEARPTRRMIFLAALLAQPGVSEMQQRVVQPDKLPPFVGENNGLNRDRFYTNCSVEDGEWALGQLRYQSRHPFEEVTPLQVWPPVPSSYIVCTEDHAISPAWGRFAARERLGIAAYTLQGSDHSPMLSRPEELAQVLVTLSELD